MTKKTNEFRVPPQNLEAERAVLGAILIDPDALDNIVEMLKPGDFYDRRHAVIFTAATDLFKARMNVDLVTISDGLQKSGKMEEAGGAAYLPELVESVATAANSAYYAEIVKERATRRRLIEATTQLSTQGYEGEPETGELLDEAERRIFEISSDKQRQQAVILKDGLKGVFEKIDDLKKRGVHITGIPTGFYDLDRITSGLQPSNLIIVGARTSAGKSAFALSLAQHAAVEAKVPVAFFTLEMSVQEVIQRMLASEGRVSLGSIRNGFINSQDMSKLTKAASKLFKADFLIDETPALTPMELRSKLRRLKSTYNIGLAVIDYLQLMRYPGKSENRQQEISEISRSLKALAREINIPIVALSQLSRKADEYSDKKDNTKRPPELSHLRESGAIEQDADLVILLHRSEMDGFSSVSDIGRLEVFIRKHRNGPLGEFSLRFEGQHMHFDNMTQTAVEDQKV